MKALLIGDLDSMNGYMERITRQTFSYFDTGKNFAHEESERFYHEFVLGLIAELSNKYEITSNRENGFGRYDVMLEPYDKRADAMILEFKVHNATKERSMADTVRQALAQIEEKKYDTVLISHGMTGDLFACFPALFEQIIRAHLLTCLHLKFPDAGNSTVHAG